MSDAAPIRRDRITIAIMALGGQGGGVLANWVLELAARNGYVAQGTSVPGVAQRTGSTVYYIEMMPIGSPGANQPAPVLALMPAPGDVDIVLASELMEAGRAILRGFVTSDRTTLIGSTHRIYAISEKSALGDGRAASSNILEAAPRRARRFVGFDMEAAALKSGSVISSILFGALAGSGALPFPLSTYEETIRKGGKAVETNLRGFTAGQNGAQSAPAAISTAENVPQPTTPAGRALADRIARNLPASAHTFALEGARRLMDYQDAAYATVYLDRVEAMRAVDTGADNFRLTRETARHVALWMAYDDTIRVADLKIRSARLAGIANEARLGADDVMQVTEYMHPRLQEVCETLPRPIGAAILASTFWRRRLEPIFSRGRHVRTKSLRWYVALRLLAGMRRIRRWSLRYGVEQKRIEVWLQRARDTAAVDAAFATEIVRLQRLIKGYGDTFERGLASFETVMAVAIRLQGRADAAAQVQALHEAALADDRGACLKDAVQALA